MGQVEPSIALNETDVALGDAITFTTTVANNVRNPRIEVLAYQDGVLVYGEAGGTDDTFVLGGNVDGGSIWRNVGGPATCIANLYYFTHKANTPGVVYLAADGFEAGG